MDIYPLLWECLASRVLPEAASHLARGDGRALELAPDNPAIVFAYHDGGGARPRTALAVGPTADGFGIVRIGTKVWVLAGMLNIHEQAAAIGSKHRTGDFAAARTREEATNLAARRVGNQQLIIAKIDVLAFVHHVAKYVGGDPQMSAGIEAQSVWTSE